MNVTHKAIQRLLLSIEKLQPCEQNLSRLLALTVAAHHLLSDEAFPTGQTAASGHQVHALEEVEKVLDKKLYLPSPDNDSVQKFTELKQLLLEHLRHFN